MNTEIIGLVFSREKCLERSLENLSQEKTKLYKIIDNAMNTEIIGLDESEALPGCCTVELIQQKQHLLDQSKTKLHRKYKNTKNKDRPSKGKNGHHQKYCRNG